MTLHILNQHISNAPMITHSVFSNFWVFCTSWCTYCSLTESTEPSSVPPQWPTSCPFTASTEPSLSPLSDLPPARSGWTWSVVWSRWPPGRSAACQSGSFYWSSSPWGSGQSSLSPPVPVNTGHEEPFIWVIIFLFHASQNLLIWNLHYFHMPFFGDLKSIYHVFTRHICFIHECDV